jgi:spore germination protein
MAAPYADKKVAGYLNPRELLDLVVSKKFKERKGRSWFQVWNIPKYRGYTNMKLILLIIFRITKGHGSLKEVGSLLHKIFKRLFHQKKNAANNKSPQFQSSRASTISRTLSVNLTRIKNDFRNTDDLVIREFDIGTDKRTQAALIYLEGMVNTDILVNQVLKSSMLEIRQVTKSKEPVGKDIFAAVKEMITASEVAEISQWDRLVSDLLAGRAILLVDGSSQALVIDAIGWQHRGVQQPVAESVIRGARDSFTESVKINITLIRRRLRDPSLKVEMWQLGRRSRTDVALLYIEDIIDPGILDEVRKRLQTIDIDSITESSYVEQLITDAWWSPFSTTQETERPDEVAAGLLEGRFAIICDNSPFVILAPTTINTSMHSPEDYYLSYVLATFFRFIRFVGTFTALTLPALYISLVAYHPEMIPTSLALSIAATRVRIPFPAITEAFILEIALEFLREAGVRLPGPLGQIIGIVGGLVIGDAAVRAGIVSPIMVIVVATAAITSFLIPTYSVVIALRSLRFPLMLLAAFLGIFGVAIGLLAILAHLATLKSFGVSMLYPWSPLRIRELQDTIIRFPIIAMRYRPGYLRPQDPDRLHYLRHEDVKRKKTS